MSLQQTANPVDAGASFRDAAMMIKVGDFEYVDPTNPGHDYLDDKPEPVAKAGRLLAFGRKFLNP